MQSNGANLGHGRTIQHTPNVIFGLRPIHFPAAEGYLTCPEGVATSLPDARITPILRGYELARFGPHRIKQTHSPGSPSGNARSNKETQRIVRGGR
jgi:hypothetical protein